jgi:biopolymer transport protein ExbD
MVRHARIASSIPTSSMADIAFLLLVFFLVTTQFLEEEGIGMLLPEGETKVPPKKNMMYFIVSDRDDVIMKYQDDESRILVPDIRGVVRSILNENPNLIISLKPTADAPYEAMIHVLDELRAADARRISLGQHTAPAG